MDKKQVVKKIGLKMAVIEAILMILSITMIINIYSQFCTLKDAERKNLELQIKLQKLEETNNNLAKKLEYATSSAFLDEEARDKFGLGSPGDYWIKTDSSIKDIDLYPKYDQNVSGSIFMKWIRLFTR